MESEKKINWFSLFIKLIIIFVFIIIIVWIIGKIINRNSLSDKFKSNINTMEKASVKYFKEVDLPTKEGKSLKVTLKDMIDKNLVTEMKSKDNVKCNEKDSYSKITRKKKNYEVKTTLVCGEESNTITRKFDLKDCKNCNKKTKKENKKENNIEDNNKEDNNKENNNINNADSNVSTDDNTETYYEYVKETTTYSNWQRGNKTGSNIENKYEYYGIANKEYYSIGIINEKDIKNNKISYILKLNNVPNSSYYYTEVTSSNYYNSSDLNKYTSEKNISMKNNNISINNLQNYILKENNFSYKLIPYYNEGSFYVRVEINITSLNNVNKYYDEKTKNNMYIVPIKMNIKFDNGKLTTEKPNGEYETVTYYRYAETNREVIWSTEEYVEGYTKTGNVKTK